MVAALNFTRGRCLAGERHREAGVEDQTGIKAAATAGPLASRPHLRLVDTPPHEPLARGVPVAGMAVAVAAVFGLLLLVRVLQGTPPAATWAELGTDPPAPASALVGAGDQVRVAQVGDTYWAIAGELAPGSDPRPIVDRLVAVNGGSSIQVGQLVVIPADLVSP